MNLAISSTGELTYRSFDNKKISESTEFQHYQGIPKRYCLTEFCLELSSDYLVIITVNSKVKTESKPCTLYQNDSISRTTEDYS